VFDTPIILAVIATFLIAGTVKGVIGLGLPTVSLGLLAIVLNLPDAMALLLIPSLITNIWQAAQGGNGATILRRIWPFLGMATLTVWLGATVLTRVDLSVLSALLGVLLVVYGAANLAGLRFTVTPRNETWAGPLAGAINGILTGMTGSFVVPGVLYLQAIGLSRDMLIQAMGMLFTLSTLALAAALHGNGFLSMELGTLSAAALVPALIGMVLGQRIRKRLSAPLFRRVFFISLSGLGIAIIVRSLGTFL
jgi:uncharacterized membrane protein YfcA